MAYLILDDLRDMIKMLGGDADSVRDIGIAVKTLRKLVEERVNRKPADHQRSFQPKHEDRKAERRSEFTEG